MALVLALGGRVEVARAPTRLLFASRRRVGLLAAANLAAPVAPAGRAPNLIGGGPASVLRAPVARRRRLLVNFAQLSWPPGPRASAGHVHARPARSEIARRARASASRARPFARQVRARRTGNTAASAAANGASRRRRKERRHHSRWRRRRRHYGAQGRKCSCLARRAAP